MSIENHSHHPEPELPPAGGGPVVSSPARSFAPQSLLPSIMVGAVSYGGTLLVSLVIVLLAIAGLSSADQAKALDNPFLPREVTPSPWQWLFQLAAQLVAMSQFGALGTSAEVTAPFVGSVHGSASVFALPLLLTVVSLGLCFAASRWTARHRQAPGLTGGLWSEALVTAAVFALLVNVVAALASITVPVPQVKVSPINAVTFGSVLGSLVLGYAASAAGLWSVRTSAQDPRKAALAKWLRPASAAGVHGALFLVIAVPAFVIVAGVKAGWVATLTAPLWAPPAGLYLLGLGHLSPISASWSTSSSFMTSTSSQDSVFVFAPGLDPAWAGWLLVLLALLLTVVTSVFWFLRRDHARINGIGGWLALPAAFAALGLVAVALSPASASVDGSSFVSASSGSSLTLLTPLIMLVWGAGAEASARYLAPQLVRFVPAPLAAHLLGHGEVTQGPALDTDAPAGTTPAGDGAATVAAQPGTAPSGTQPVTAPPAGHPASASPALTTHPALAPREPLTPKAKKALAFSFGGAGLAVLLVVGSLVAVNVIKDSNGPDKPVTAYLQALVDGKASRALELADPGVANDQRVLLSDAVYSKASKRIDAFEIVSSKVTEDSAAVVADVHQDGRKNRSTFTLHKASPEFLDEHWTLDSGLLNKLTITPSVSVRAVTVNGQEVPVTVSTSGYQSSGQTYPALPGEYTLGLSASEKYLSAEKSTSLVTIDGGTASAPLTVGPSNALVSEASTQADAHLTECLKSTEANPSGCPFGTYLSSSTRNIKWSLVRKPAYQFSNEATGPFSSGWQIHSDETGKVKVSYERDSSYGFGTPSWKPDSETQSFTLRATVTVENGAVKLEYSRY
ncbi:MULTISPECIES: hypothetical protein [Arthrobacter]|uniref:Uncharacterized protein n=2 Tax=Arthrobacter TaxID=1663 RepID=A0ABU9KM12_9MICC|nr:hypothetical protein [Arthrobacter sp. YJM1]MDP5228119.1 hypothetical protein [Arthrobacter sp. YJM1]